MKLDLINKKTGEIGYLIVGKGSDHYVVTNNLWESCGEYNSLAELNEEWEDYEEPKVIYYISWNGMVLHSADKIGWQDAKQIGNYFETEEDAEKAREKLKAWKRLTDKGFKFEGLTYSTWDAPCIEYTVEGDCLNSDVQVGKDLDLLFGGEE